MYAIICDARKGANKGVETLALVDRSRCRRLWWTSDNANIAIAYRDRNAALFAVGRLHRNNARVVSFDTAREILTKQRDRIAKSEKYDDFDGSWDAHNAG